MIKVIGVRFRRAGKIYYFDPDEIELKEGDKVIVETIRGIECGNVIVPNHEVNEEQIIVPLRRVIRKATEEDLEHVKENRKSEVEAAKIFKEKIAKHGLKMKLVDVEYTFDNNKILFYFTADGRVDFRELVKDLASVFKTRIELRQIGVRDEAKMMGGIGVCGRTLCCSTHLCEFHPVSIKMAKEQGLSLNPTKISGLCGRLMCCLKYEQEVYEELIGKIPNIDAVVKTPDGIGVVVAVSVLKEKIKVKLDDENETEIREYHADQIEIIRNAEQNDEPEVPLEELKELED